jgi:choline dehydrogenase
VPLITKNWSRHAVRDFIVDTINSGFPLPVRTNSHVTKLDFTGYLPRWPLTTLPDHFHSSWYALKAHTRNTAGTVALRSPDPLDTPIVNFNYFDTGTTASGADQDDLGALVQAVRMARQALSNYTTYSSLGGSAFVEQNPGANVTSDEDIEQYIKDRAWGHRASCTNKIGAASGGSAVLDSEFRVRGTVRLRVADAKTFPKIPGIFIQAPIIMTSEKAADVILSGSSYIRKRCFSDRINVHLGHQRHIHLCTSYLRLPPCV